MATDRLGRQRVVQRLKCTQFVRQTLRDALRSKEVWVVGARRYHNPDEDLPADFDLERASYYAALHQPLGAEEIVDNIRTQLSKCTHQLDTYPLRIGIANLTPTRAIYDDTGRTTSMPHPGNLPD